MSVLLVLLILMLGLGLAGPILATISALRTKQPSESTDRGVSCPTNAKMSEPGLRATHTHAASPGDFDTHLKRMRDR